MHQDFFVVLCGLGGRDVPIYPICAEEISARALDFVEGRLLSHALHKRSQNRIQIPRLARNDKVVEVVHAQGNFSHEAVKTEILLRPAREPFDFVEGRLLKPCPTQAF